MIRRKKIKKIAVEKVEMQSKKCTSHKRTIRRVAVSVRSRTRRAPRVRAQRVVSPSAFSGVLPRQARALVLPSHWQNKKGYENIFDTQKPVFTRSMARAFAVLLLIGLNVFNFTNVRSTEAYFFDSEGSPLNSFQTGKLDIILSNTTFEGVVSNAPDDEVQFSTNVSLISGSLDTHYALTSGNASGTLCADLDLEAEHAPITYTGDLEPFVIDPATNDFGAWLFAVTLPPEVPFVFDAVCEFDIIFSAWLEGFQTLPESGFYDEEVLHVKIGTDLQSPVVINEFLPTPDDELFDGGGNLIFDFGKDSDDMPQGEWVELYNLTGEPLDLTDWYLTDASGGVGNTDITGINTIPATTIIAANGFLTVYMNKPVWNNTGDTVKLLDGSDVLRDSYSYTSAHDFCELIPTPGEENDETGSGTSCSNTQVPGNKSFARIPDGTGAFVDPVPTPGFANTEEDLLAQTFLDAYTATLGALESVPALMDEQASTTQPFSEEASEGEMTSTTNEVPEDENVATSTDEIEPKYPEIPEESASGGGSSSADETPDEDVAPEETPAREDDVPEASAGESETEDDGTNETSVSRPEEEDVVGVEEVSESEPEPEASHESENPTEASPS